MSDFSPPALNYSPKYLLFFGYSWELQLLLVSSAQCAIGLLWDNGRGRRPRQVFNTISSQPSGSLQTCDEYWEAAGDYIVFWLERRVMIRFTVDQLHKPEAVEKQKKYYHPPPAGIFQPPAWRLIMRTTSINYEGKHCICQFHTWHLLTLKP